MLPISVWAGCQFHCRSAARHMPINSPPDLGVRMEYPTVRCRRVWQSMCSVSDGTVARVRSRRQHVRSAVITVYLRLALGIGFLSAVADRFGWWGPPGTPNVAWGNFGNYLAYTVKLNPWFPRGRIPAIGWAATVCEVCFGLMLIIGY